MNKLDHLTIINETSKYADFSEVYEERVKVSTLENDTGRIEKCIELVDWGASLRSFKSNEIFFTATNFESSDELLAKHIKILESKGENSSQLCYEKKISNDFVFSKGIHDYIKTTDRLYKDLMSSLKGLLNVKLSFQRYEKQYMVTHSMGISVGSETKGERFSIQLVVGTGETKFTVYDSVGYTFREITEEDIAMLFASCVERAKIMEKAKPGPAGIFTCILSSEAGGTLIHEAVGHGLEADLVDKGISIYKDRLGEKVASSLISVVDDATYKNGYGSYFVDDEGTPSNRNVLIEKGILKGYLYDNFYALKHKKVSTGNGRRQSYAFKPFPRMTNTFILSGESEPKNLLDSLDKGILVKKMGGGQVNTLTGDFIFEILEGYWVEKGEIAYPLKNLSIIGNGPEILLKIDGVAKDFGTAVGTCGKEGQGVPVGDGQPTLLIPNITVGGSNL